jgi:hypothetical protein
MKPEIAASASSKDAAMVLSAIDIRMKLNSVNAHPNTCGDSRENQAFALPCRLWTPHSSPTKAFTSKRYLDFTAAQRSAVLSPRQSPFAEGPLPGPSQSIPRPDASAADSFELGAWIGETRLHPGSRRSIARLVQCSVSCAPRREVPAAPCLRGLFPWLTLSYFCSRCQE